MKKKGIILSIIGIILVSSLLIVLVSKNGKKTFMQDGIMFAVKVDGVNQKTFPSGTNYYVDVDCENGKGSYIYDVSTSTWKVAVSEITGNVTCNVSYTSNPITLKEEVESLKNRVEFVPQGSELGNEGVIDETQNSASDYSNATVTKNLSPSYFRNTFDTSTTQTETGNFWTYNTSTGVFTSVPSTMTTSGYNAYYHAYAQVPEAGNYRICYTIAKASSINNSLSIAIGTSSKRKISASRTATVEGCCDLGSLTTSDYINVSEGGYSGTSSPVITFTLEKGGSKAVSAGYRYEGPNPNNYVWFNNEMWRIIGSIPTCTNADCSTSEYLVKIIRKDSIGSVTYDAKASSTATTEWGNNTLYTLLNTYYYGNTSNAKTDATGTNYCYGYYTATYQPRTKCDYRVIGMKNTDYYGSMIKNVYWNVGTTINGSQLIVIYEDEKARKKDGYVGLMNASDYGYASSSIMRKDFFLPNYDVNAVSQYNWLHKSDRDWIINNAKFVEAVGAVSGGTAYYGYAVRPVVYLDSSVKVVSGDGSEANPYQIMKVN